MMMLNEKVDALNYLCDKLGLKAYYDYATPFIFTLKKIIVKELYLNVHFIPCAENVIYYENLHITLNAITLSLSYFLCTKTFSVKEAKGQIKNPFFGYYDELMSSRNIDMFKVNADLIFPNDMSNEIISFFKRELMSYNLKRNDRKMPKAAIFKNIYYM